MCYYLCRKSNVQVLLNLHYYSVAQPRILLSRCYKTTILQVVICELGGEVWMAMHMQPPLLRLNHSERAARHSAPRAHCACHAIKYVTHCCWQRIHF